MGKKTAPSRNASKKAMQKKAARKKALAKKASQQPKLSGLGSLTGINDDMVGMGSINLPGMNVFNMNMSPAMLAQANAFGELERKRLLLVNKQRFAQNAQANEGVKHFLIKVTFTKTDTPVWRRLVVDADDQISSLYDKIQSAFDWDDDHLSIFYWDRNCRQEFACSVNDPWTFEPDPQMREVLREGATLGYVYNLFQEFTHTIKVEKAMVEYDYDPDLQMEQGTLPELPGTAVIMPLSSLRANDFSTTKVR